MKKLIDIANDLDVEKELVHLHLHTWYSFLDGMSNPEAVAKKAKEEHMRAVAITDHNSLAGIWHFQKACHKEGVKPILGLEAYWTWDMKLLAMDAKERTDYAMQRALAAGVEIPAKINGKKTTKKQINELISDYSIDVRQYHVLFLAKNMQGWRNLTELQSIASDQCTYNGRYLCDNALIEKYHEGLIMTTACIGGVVPRLIAKGKLEEAETIIDKWHSIFKDDFYLEIQPLCEADQYLTNLIYMKWAKEKNINLVATSDVHYVNQEDHADHDVLLCIGTGSFVDEANRMRYTNDFWMRSYEELLEAFDKQRGCIQHIDLNQELSMAEEEMLSRNKEFTEAMIQTITDNVSLINSMYNDNTYVSAIIEAIQNTVKIANQVTDDIKLGSDTYLFPNVDIPVGLTAEGHLTNLCYTSLYKYKKEHPEIELRTYEKRLCEELNVINTKGFAPYMLTVFDLVNWCDRNDVPVGPGRGSAAGALVLFLLGVTKGIDPIKYQLLFFRFLTMDRTAMPDIDTDFSYIRRQDVIRYLEEKYGHDNVSGIGTFTLMGVKSGLKDVGRVLRVDFSIMNAITKKIDEITDEEPSIKFKDIDALKEQPDDLSKKKYADWVELEAQYPELFRLARVFEGTPRNMGVHASGVLITPNPVSSYFPTRTVDGKRVTFYTGPQLEEANAVKLDILGLATLDVIDLTLKAMTKPMTLTELYTTVSTNDKKAYKMISNKETEGLFQIESNLFKSIISDMQPESINDIIALTSLGRPGPLQAGMHTMYNNRKNGIEEAVEPLPNTWDIVQDTYGCIVYQEQIMLLAKRVAKFDDNQTDSYLRKALAKKQREKMDLCKQWFIYGKINASAPNDYDELDVNQSMYDPKGKYGPAILGGVANGYDPNELSDFWDTMEGYAKYLFNKSHAACYSLITNITAVLKSEQKAKFFAALLSLQKDQDDIELYIKTARANGVEVLTPDINQSNYNFKEVNGKVLYGLSKIKGVGATSIPEIIANRPYESLTDALERLPKKALNKRVGVALIKSGAFDMESENRLALLNTFHEFRKDEEHYVAEEWDKETCMIFESETVSTSISYVPYWETISNSSKVKMTANLKAVAEKPDKNGRLMGFLTLTKDGQDIKALMFATSYVKAFSFLEVGSELEFTGKKDDKGTFIINSVKPLAL